jgi:hypothetical protein
MITASTISDRTVANLKRREQMIIIEKLRRL